MNARELEEFCEYWYAPMRAYLMSVVRNWDLVEDLVQELFTGICANAYRLHTDTAKRYLWRCAKFIGYEGLRRRSQLTPEFDDGLRHAYTAFPPPEASTCTRMVLEEALAELKPLERFVIERGVLQGTPLSTIAAELKPRSMSEKYISDKRDSALIKLKRHSGVDAA